MKLVEILLLLAPAIASAATKQTFSGTLCESLYDVNSVLGESIDYQYGALWNRGSADWGYVQCAVPRANGYASGTISDFEVTVTDTVGAMWCSVSTLDRYGNYIASETVNSTGTGQRVLDFGSIAGPPYEGFIDLFCVVPLRGGAIHSYVVDIN